MKYTITECIGFIFNLIKLHSFFDKYLYKIVLLCIYVMMFFSYLQIVKFKNNSVQYIKFL